MDSSNKIFIGNVAYATAIESLVEMASKFGEVVESYKPLDKGFAFITFKTAEQALAAIEGMNGKEVDGREINVSIARPREDRPRRDFGGRSNGGNRGGFDRSRDSRPRF
jgi:RNA recognition motif-containing protein